MVALQHLCWPPASCLFPCSGARIHHPLVIAARPYLAVPCRTCCVFLVQFRLLHLCVRAPVVVEPAASSHWSATVRILAPALRAPFPASESPPKSPLCACFLGAGGLLLPPYPIGARCVCWLVFCWSEPTQQALAFVFQSWSSLLSLHTGVPPSAFSSLPCVRHPRACLACSCA